MAYVYAVQMLIPHYINPVKIGTCGTMNRRSRIGVYTKEPFPVVCLGTWKGSYADEKEVHRRFASCRLEGEWFYPREDLLLFVQSKTGLVNLSPRLPAQFGTRSTQRALEGIVNHVHRRAVQDVIRKAGEVVTRFRTRDLSERQLAILLDLPPATLRELKAKNEISGRSENRYSLEDVIEFLIESPEFAAAAQWQDSRERDERLYRIVW